MEIQEQLQEDGWVLSPEGFNTITDDGKITNKQELIQKMLNTDVRDLGGCSFPSELTKGKCEMVTGPVVVQIQKIRNISAPKANEESQAAPRMLKLILTDGTQVIPAIEMTSLQPISLNTYPGTKLRLKGEIIVSNGLLQLNSSQVDVLGGIVTNLVEKWTVNRNLAKHTRGRYGVEGGPPPWIPFGEKMAPTNLSDKNFKSLDDGSKENKDNDEFEAQRRDAIAEAGKAGCSKKVFGGGTKPLLDKNVQAIMEKGFTLQQAEAALRQSRNNVERALKSLTKRTGRGNDEKGEKEKEGQRRRKGEDESGPKPSGRVCLFQYLEEKLPFLPEKEKSLSKDPEKREWDNSHFNYRGSMDGGSSGGRGGRNERSRGGGSSGRGGGAGHNPHNREYSNTDRKPKDEHHKDNRNSRWQNPNHSQKPPRFQNQNKQRIEPQTSEHFDHFITRSSDNGNSRNRSNADGYFASKNNGNNVREQPNNAQPFNGYRNNFKMDNMGQFNNSQSGGDHRNQSSSFFKPTGMPDIPEFPYKDSSSYAPIVSQSNSCSGIPDIPAFPYKDNSAFKPMSASNNHSGNQVNNRNSGNPAIKQEKYRWNKGDKCIAKYWEDNMYYDAEVTGVSKKTCVVRFLEYGNFEEVLQDDCIPITEDLPNVQSNHTSNNSNFHNNKRSNNHFSGVLEFRRGGNRPYVKLEGMGPRKNHRQSQPVYMPPPGRQPK